MEADAAVIASVCGQRGQGNFELAAHKVLPADRSNDCRCALARTLVVGMGRFFRKRWRKMRKRRNIH